MTRDQNIAAIVHQFYNETPFPGFDVDKYDIPDDLYRNANRYARVLDDQIPHGKSVLDVGCGTGQLACLLSVKGRRVVGVDFSEQSLAKANELKARLRLDNVAFHRQDVLSWEDDGQRFDYIFCNGVLHHTPNPYLGFQNLCQFARAGTYIVIGLYNRYGRLFHRTRRVWRRWWHGSDAAAEASLIQKMLVKPEDDAEKQETWYADQYRHPYESVHTVGEVLGWFRRHGVGYVNSLPPFELGRSETKAAKVFRPASVPSWRRGALARFLAQASWVVSLAQAGGYYLLVGRKE